MARGRVQVAPKQKIVSDWGNAVWDQSVQSFATAADRDSQFPQPAAGAMCFLEDVAQHYGFVTGKWLPVAIQGLPQTPVVVTDLNTATKAGFYWIASGANQPISGRSYHVWTYCATDDPTNMIQVAYRATVSMSAVGVESWQRVGSKGSWGPWVYTGGGNSNMASGTNDANGYLTVTHGMGFTPSEVLVTMYPQTSYTAGAVVTGAVHNITATTFQVRCSKAVGITGQSNVYGLSWTSPGDTRFFWQAIP